MNGYQAPVWESCPESLQSERRLRGDRHKQLLRHPRLNSPLDAGSRQPRYSLVAQT